MGSLPCCHHCQLLFTGLHLFVKHASPDGVVSSEVLPGINVDVECLHVSLACILVPQLQAASASLPGGKLSIEDVFWNLAILHVADMAKPAQPMLSQQGVHGGEASPRQDVSIGHLVLP